MEHETQYRSIWTHLYDVAFTQGFVDAGGVSTRYIQAGPRDAPAVIFLHGTAASWESCCANIRPHAAHFNTFAIDVVGAGLSDKPDHLYDLNTYVEHLKNFMDAMGLECTAIVGVSLGSFIAAKFAQRYPERTSKVTMVSPIGLPFRDDPNANEQLQGQKQIDDFRKQRQAQAENPTWEAMEELIKPLIQNPKDRIPDLIAIRQAVYRQPAMLAAMHNIMDLYAPAVFNREAILPEEWGQISVPFLLTLSVDSKDFAYEMALEINRLLPDSRLLECPGAAHWPQWECPDLFNEANIAFLLQP